MCKIILNLMRLKFQLLKDIDLTYFWAMGVNSLLIKPKVFYLTLPNDPEE